MRVAIVGGGVIGCAIALEARHRGFDVTVQDWYPIADKTDLEGYYVCIGTSGSSFKTAPVLGRLMAEIIESCAGGTDIDTESFQLALPRIGATVDTRFLSRLRKELTSTSTVIG